MESASSNFRQVLLPADDGISTSIAVPGGFAFDNTSQSTVYVRDLLLENTTVLESTSLLQTFQFL